MNAIAQADFARGLAEATLHRRAMVIAELERVERRIERGTELGYCVVPTVPDPIRVLPRGQAGAAGPLVAPGGVEVVRTSSPDFGLGADSSDAARRRRLAEWMTGAGNPVFARVAVNRIWAQLFGRGLVTTPSDFGRTGARPSHPQLLEWLAKWFATSGYRIKALVRELVCCATYRQATEAAEVMVRADPTNRWLARRGVKRLEAEAIRDAILVASGCLDRTLGGPSDRDFDVVTRGPTFFYEPKEVGWSAGPSGKPMARRSLYRMWARGGRNRLFEAFDCPDPSVATPVRAQTTTPLQALALLNSELVSVMAAAMARRVQSEYHSSTAQLTAAYELALGRPPTAGEAAKMEPLLREYGLSVLARALFNSHEFVHVH